MANTRTSPATMSPDQAIQLLKEGNKRFVNDSKIKRNLLQQARETSKAQYPFAVVISCMDSRVSAELIFDQGLGDIFSIRVAGNVINEDILGSVEFGCKIAGAKAVLVLGHTGCGAIRGAVENVDLGHLRSISSKIQRCFPRLKQLHKPKDNEEFIPLVTKENVLQSLDDLRVRSSILEAMERDKEIKIVGGIYDVGTGVVDFFDH